MTRNLAIALGTMALLTGCDAVERQVVLSSALELSATEPGSNAAPARRVWARAGDYASPSPDGRYIAFTDWSTGDVAMHDIVTGQDQRLTDKGSWTEDGSWSEEPLFSPDGKRVAYSYGNAKGMQSHQYELRVVTVGDTTQTVLYALTPEDDWIMATDWHASQGILVEIFRGERHDFAIELAIVDPENGSVRVLRTFTEEQDFPHAGAISPDGRFVVYRNNEDVRVMGVNGTGDQSLDLEVRFVLGWSRDGRAVLVHASGQGTTGIWSVPVADGRRDGEPTLVRGGMAALLPGGFAGESYYYLVPVDAPRLFTTSIDIPSGQVLSPPVAVTSPLDGMALHPAWSPDGRSLAYPLRSLVDFSERILLRTADGDQVRELASIPRCRIHEMAWSPDGETLLVHAQVREGRSLLGVDIRSGEVREVYSDLGWAMTIAPDGRLVHVIVADQPNRPAGVYVRDLATGQEHRIVERLSSRPALGVSPDGQRVALVFTDNDAGTAHVSTVPIDGGPMREIARLTYPQHYETHGFGSAVWTPDGRYILAMRGEWEREGSHDIVAVPVDGGEPIHLKNASPGERGHALHPDGRRIAYTGGQPRMELWVLDDLTPSPQ